MVRFAFFAAVLLAASPVHAWNALGHRVIASIAWQEMNPPARVYVAAVLRRHPRFAEDFSKQMPAGVADEDEWIFGQAAVWPDLARGFAGDDRKRNDHPTWHYVNHPIFTGGELPLFKVNLSSDYPPPEAASEWNICQAVKHCQVALNSKAPPQNKAMAVCWLAHLVGDLHQPMHSSALFSDRFPTGDRGGNSIKTVQGENLHSLWDNLLGRGQKPNDVKREVAELRARPQLFNVGSTSGVDAWILESRELAKSFAYSPEILKAVEPRGDVPPVNLSRSYLEAAGEHARQRIAAGGVRLGALIDGFPISPVESQRTAKPTLPAEPTPVVRSRVPVQTFTPSTAKPSLGYWLNENGNVRHNAGCRYYENTKRGRACSASEGKPCGICGG